MFNTTKIVSINNYVHEFAEKRLFFLWQPLAEAFEICFQNSIQTMCADTPEGKDKWCELKTLVRKLSFYALTINVKSVTFDNPFIQNFLQN